MHSLFKYKVGDTVIVRSNEDQPYWVGSVLHEDSFPTRGDKIPLVIRHSDQKEFMVMGMVVQHDMVLVAELEKRSPKEQWDYLKHLKYGDKADQYIG